jgi:hypothetical protein
MQGTKWMTLRIRPTSRPEGKEGRLEPPRHPPRGCAARIAGPESDVLEDRKRRPDAAIGSDRRPSSLRWAEASIL